MLDTISALDKLREILPVYSEHLVWFVKKHNTAPF